jgi:hypothetical protein
MHAVVLSAEVSSVVHHCFRSACCLLSAPAGPAPDFCSVSSLPAPPSGSAYTSANGCNVVGAIVSEGLTCTADCLPGFIKGGSPNSHIYACLPDPAGIYPIWSLLVSGMTCTGKAWEFKLTLSHLSGMRKRTQCISSCKAACRCSALSD